MQLTNTLDNNPGKLDDNFVLAMVHCTNKHSYDEIFNILKQVQAQEIKGKGSDLTLVDREANGSIDVKFANGHTLNMKKYSPGDEKK